MSGGEATSETGAAPKTAAGGKSGRDWIPPGSVLGVLGSGQLGRMFAMAARQMGYRVHTFSPDDDTPAGQVSDVEIQASYDDLDAVRAFARNTKVVTFEFENVPSATTQAAAELTHVRPGGKVLHTTQHRLREKQFLAKNGIPHARFLRIASLAELEAGLAQIGCPAVLKTAGWGYDGKGQLKITAPDQAAAAWKKIGEQEAVLEEWVSFAQEVSVVAARGRDGEFVHYGVLGNTHVNHILDVTVAPALVSPQVAREAVEIARSILETLDVVGVLCVEFFLTADDRLVVNELAPRPHNSGHVTIDACVTSQFEQQVRAICGLPLGSTELLRPAAMANLLGDLWVRGPMDWAAAAGCSDVKLHLYGKLIGRPGRKMGHLTALADTPDEAVRKVLAARRLLSGGAPG